MLGEVLDIHLIHIPPLIDVCQHDGTFNHMIQCPQLKVKGVTVFKHDGTVVGKGQDWYLPEPVDIKLFIVNQIKVIALPGIVAKSYIGNNSVNRTIVLDKSTGAEFYINHGQEAKPGNVSHQGLPTPGKIEPVDLI